MKQQILHIIHWDVVGSVLEFCRFLCLLSQFKKTGIAEIITENSRYICMQICMQIIANY